MSKLISFLAIVTFLSFLGCGTGSNPDHVLELSGRTHTFEMELADFTRIEAGYAFDVEIRQAESFSVVLEVDESLVPYLDVETDGNILFLLLDSEQPYNLQGECLKAIVDMPAVESIVLKDAARASGNVDVESLSVAMTDASSVELTGSASYLELNQGSASQATLIDFPVKDVHATLEGASYAAVHATESLFAILSGASQLTYTGDPEDVDIAISGASQAEPEN